MTDLRRRYAVAAALSLPAFSLTVARTARAQSLTEEATREPPRSLDVPYVSTPMIVVDAMLDMARVRRDDLLIDLGCGDGRIVLRAAERFGCRGIGVDLDPRRIDDANAAARRASPGVRKLVRFELGDVFSYDFSAATVITMYLLPSVNLRLRPRLLRELKPGTRIVSHDFDLGDWPAEQTRKVDETSVVYRWTVPRDPSPWLK